jgi:hypothetical protein
MADDKPTMSDDGACILECVTYHDGSRRMKERRMIGPFTMFLGAHEAMTKYVDLKQYDDILIHRLTPYEKPSDEHPSAA